MQFESGLQWMRNGGKNCYHFLDTENDIRSWAIVVVLLYEVYDIKWFWGKAFSQATELYGGIFEDNYIQAVYKLDYP